MDEDPTVVETLRKLAKEYDNYFIWWMQHPKNKAWYTNIQTREQEPLWIKKNVFWICAEATDNLEDAVRALRQNYA